MLANFARCLCGSGVAYNIDAEEDSTMLDGNEICFDCSVDFSDYVEYGLDRIIQNGPATIVFWEDGIKTVVKRSKNDPESDIYSVVAYALAKKLYGSNSQFKKLVDKCLEVKNSND